MCLKAPDVRMMKCCLKSSSRRPRGWAQFSREELTAMTEQEALEALKGKDRLLAATAEAILWRTWCRSGTSETDAIFRAGVEAMQQRKLAEAEVLFSRVIQLAPEFAEGWNKRATVRYVM